MRYANIMHLMKTILFELQLLQSFCVFVKMVKVICAGAPKTGTKSMAKALRILGYNEGNLKIIRFFSAFQ